MNEAQIIEKLKQLVVLDENETAEQAVARYQSATKVLADYEEENLSYYGKYPKFREKITEEQLASEEKRLNITLPDAYKNFVVKNGLVTYGSYGEDERQMLFPLRRLSDELKSEWEMTDEKINNAYKNKLHPDNLIVFSYGDETLQSEWFHCFQPDGKVYDFNQDYMYEETPKRLHHSFDNYMQWATNKFIICGGLEYNFEYYDLENWGMLGYYH